MSAFVRTFKVGPYRITVTIPETQDSVQIAWQPLPRRLSKKQIAEYLVKRNACFRAYAASTGITLTAITPGTDCSFVTIAPEVQS